MPVSKSLWYFLTGQSLPPNTWIHHHQWARQNKEPWHEVIRNKLNVQNISHIQRLYKQKAKHVVPRDNDFLPRSISLFIRSIKALFVSRSTSMCLCLFSICLRLFRALSPLSTTKMNETLEPPLLPSSQCRCSTNMYNSVHFKSYSKYLWSPYPPIKNSSLTETYADSIDIYRVTVYICANISIIFHIKIFKE